MTVRYLAPTPSFDMESPPLPKSTERVEFPRWYPCEFPERPVDRLSVFHDCCRACYIAAQASESHGFSYPYHGTTVTEIMRQRLMEHGEAAP